MKILRIAIFSTFCFFVTSSQVGQQAHTSVEITAGVECSNGHPCFYALPPVVSLSGLLF